MIYDNLHTELIYFWLEKKSIFREPAELVFNKDYKCTFDVENTNVEVEYLNIKKSFEKIKFNKNKENLNSLSIISNKLNEIPKTNFFADNISFNVLAGANGTGKSTILKFMYEIMATWEHLGKMRQRILN